jgi:hypothetical protein
MAIRLLLLITGLALLARAAAASDFEAGVRAYDAGDYENAFHIWLPLAKGEDLAAQYNVALLFEHGLGVEADMDAALDWYIRAAEAGYPTAQVKIGDFYRTGLWGEKRLPEALSWYQLAAEQGNETAGEMLALLGTPPPAPPIEETSPQSVISRTDEVPPGITSRSEVCPARPDRGFKVRVSIAIPTPPINHSLSRAELTARSFHGPDAQVLGLMVPDLSVETRVEQASEVVDGHICYWLESVYVDLVYKSIEVFVAREYRKGSCEYEAILRHEQEHVDIARDNLERYKPKVRAALTSLLLPTPQRPVELASLGGGEEPFDALFKNVLEPVYKNMQADLTRAQASIDTPASYALVRASCTNW